MSMEILQDALKFSKEEIIYLTNQIKIKDELLSQSREELEKQKKLAQSYKDMLDKHNIIV